MLAKIRIKQTKKQSLYTITIKCSQHAKSFIHAIRNIEMKEVPDHIGIIHALLKYNLPILNINYICTNTIVSTKHKTKNFAAGFIKINTGK